MLQSKIIDEEKQGVKMIQFLQKFAGIEESDEKALKGWRGMSNNEKESTKKAYKLCGGK